MGRVAVAVCAAALLMGASACGERSEPTGAGAGLYPVTITTGDRPITISEPARRIAVLDATSAQLVRSLGAGQRIVAATASLGLGALRRAT
jgi:ABC-type Fe3+-hydroxamate transport system substrate-binding protein